MKCQLIKENCIACGLCQLYAPEIFDYNDFNSIVQFKGFPEENSVFFEEQDEAIIEAYHHCPTRAIRLIKNVSNDD